MTSLLLKSVVESDERSDLRQFVRILQLGEKRYLLRNEILAAFDEYCREQGKPNTPMTQSRLGKLIFFTQEIIVDNESLCWIIRPRIAQQEVYRLLEDLTIVPMSVPELLDLRDRFVNRYHPNEGDVFEIDVQPFYDYSPTIRDSKNIGKGVAFLNRYLSSKLFQDPRQWQQNLFNFLQVHRYNGCQLLINERIRSPQHLSEQVKQAIIHLGDRPAAEPYNEFRFDLQTLGFEPGWGNTAARVRDTLEILDQLLDSPDHQVLEAFVSRIPMIFRIALISPHGWFGQEGVLGRPDTGGQVVYILDQVKSLEKQIREDLELAGLDVLDVHPKIIVLTRLIPNAEGTLCNQRLEKIYGTTDAWILRVPFREFNPAVTQNWISRFEIWPYLETFAIDAERELRAEFGHVPDLIIGNYSDGNLVAFFTGAPPQGHPVQYCPCP
nr:hypothetical protein [Thermostichus lividus]